MDYPLGPQSLFHLRATSFFVFNRSMSWPGSLVGRLLFDRTQKDQNTKLKSVGFWQMQVRRWWHPANCLIPDRMNLMD